MGVPRFFKWLAERYPCIISPCNTPTLPSIDNLYLDMNGIIHVCTHSNDKKVSQQESEKFQMQKIFSYIDKLFQMVQPTQYFYMAIDGVAPRAKMNQQRQRRFRSAFEAEEERKKLLKEGKELPDESFDSNCITPGTPFMVRLSQHLKYYIAHKIETDVKWQRCKVIYSGHDVPGEGEHKIVDFIRKRKMSKGYNPNEKHVLYGLDADLIMLGLMTHEPHFMLLREDVFEQFNYRRGEEHNKPLQKNFQLLHLSVLREYFDLEFKVLWKEGSKRNQKFEDYNLERIVDDFVFICFFCGNDFLPHSPTLDIGEGAVGLLFSIYQETVLEVGYLTKDTKIQFDRVQVFCNKIAAREEEILLDRYETLKKKTKFHKHYRASVSRMEGFMPKKENGSQGVQRQRAEIRTSSTQYNASQNFFSQMEDELEVEEELEKQNQMLEKDHIDGLTSLSRSGIAEQDEEMVDIIEHENMEDEEEEEEFKKSQDLFSDVPPGSKFNFAGWRAAYYQDKLKIDYSNEEEMGKLIKSYISGLQWVYHYYYHGCASWGWYFPYSYSPLMTDIAASDMESVAASVKFELGVPFYPFQQLLGVLPPSSSELLPEVYRPLMTSANSPLADMFPSSLKIDREGTKYEYEGVVILPFIDEDRLREAENSLDLDKLSDAQKKQNILGKPEEYFYDDNAKMSVQPLMKDMPSVVNAKVAVKTWDEPKTRPFVPQLCKGVKMGRKGPQGFPTLEAAPVEGEIRSVGTNILGHPSKKPSLCVLLKEVTNYQCAKDALHLLGTEVHIGYPMPQPAIVSSVADVDESYYGDANAAPEIHNAQEQEQFQKEAHHHQSLLYQRFALDIGEVRVLVFCRLFKGMMKDPSGNTVMKFSSRNKEYAYPSQLVLSYYHPIPDPRFQRRQFYLQDEFKKGTEVMCLDEKNYGRKATVIQTNPPYSIHLNVEIPLDESKISYPSELTEGSDLRYFSLKQVCKMLSYPNGTKPTPKCLGLMTTEFKVSAPDGNRKLIGLKLRHVKNGKILLHHTRCKMEEQKSEQNYFLNFGAGNKSNQSSKFSVGSVFDWEYSEKAVALLREYIQEFPDVFYGVEGGKRVRTAQDLLPEIEDPIKYLDDVRAWLDSKELKKKLFISATNNYLDREHLDKVEQAAINFKKSHPVMEIKTTEVKVTSKQVYKPSDPVFKGMIDPHSLDIGHRVVYIRKEGQVPFALRGVIVGIEKDSAQVIFDDEFTGGSTFSDTLQTNRGQIVPKYSLLNLTIPRVANPENFKGFHFSEKKSQNFQENTPYNSAHYYNVARKPPRGNIDISKPRKIVKSNKPRKSISQIRDEAGVASASQTQTQQKYQPKKLMKKADSVVKDYSYDNIVQNAWFQNLSQHSVGQSSTGSSGWNPASAFINSYSQSRSENGKKKTSQQQHVKKQPEKPNQASNQGKKKKNNRRKNKKQEHDKHQNKKHQKNQHGQKQDSKQEQKPKQDNKQEQNNQHNQKQQRNQKNKNNRRRERNKRNRQKKQKKEAQKRPEQAPKNDSVQQKNVDQMQPVQAPNQAPQQSQGPAMPQLPKNLPQNPQALFDLPMQQPPRMQQLPMQQPPMQQPPQMHAAPQQHTQAPANPPSNGRARQQKSKPRRRPGLVPSQAMKNKTVKTSLQSDDDLERV